jgi:hypothetical protein
MPWPKDDTEEFSGEMMFGYPEDPPEQDQTREPKRTPGVERAQRLLDWIQNDLARSEISLRDICAFGPRAVRAQETAIESAEMLVKAGWLIPTKTHRHDRHVWQVVRKPIVQPTVRL